MHPLAMRVKTGDVKQRTMKSERGTILMATKHASCIVVRMMLAVARTAQVCQVYFKGFCPTLTPWNIDHTPNITTCNKDQLISIIIRHEEDLSTTGPVFEHAYGCIALLHDGDTATDTR